jgi:hyaluronan synthase
MFATRSSMVTRRGSYRLLSACSVLGVSTLIGVWLWALAASRALVVVIVLGTAVASMVARLVLAYLDRARSGAVPEARVSIVLPVYNEDPELFRRVLGSIGSQTRLPDRVWIVDDASSSRDCLHLAERWAAQHGALFDVRVHAFPENRSKRFAQAVAFEHDADADIFITIDSDTVMAPDAVEECLKAFADPEVFGVAGLVLGLNWSHSLLTRVIDIEFVTNFIQGRAALGKLGSVLTTCGALAAYRSAPCREHLDEYLHETFLGASVQNGDDRKLTQYSLLRGKVVFQETFVGRAALPESLGHLVRQRTRWYTSFYRGSLWMLRHMPRARLAYWLTVVNVVRFIGQTALLAGLAVLAMQVDWSHLGLAWLVYIVAYWYLRGLRYLAFRRADMPLQDQLLAFALGPLVSLLYRLVLTPTSYYALFKLRSGRWLTREAVEVRIGENAMAA